MTTLLVATRNKHKASEIQAFFLQKGIEIEIRSLLDVSNLPNIDEDCLSFEGNALKKAQVISTITKLPTLADDSGLVVMALDGRPGVFSARYAGPGSRDEDNNRKLLTEIQNIPNDNLDAKFICSIVLYCTDGHFYTSIGELDGKIIREFRGTHGFGYDPIFYLPERNCTLAEVPEAEKITFSHRTKALENLLKMNDLKF